MIIPVKNRIFAEIVLNCIFYVSLLEITIKTILLFRNSKKGLLIEELVHYLTTKNLTAYIEEIVIYKT